MTPQNEEIITGETFTARELTPSGLHKAWCVGIVVLGTIDKTFKGVTKRVKRVRLFWELPELGMKIFDEKEGPKPIVVGKTYTLAMSSNASLRKLLAGWRGKDFTEQEAKEFNIAKMLGCSMYINLLHAATPDGHKYESVENLIKLQDNDPIQEPKTKQFIYTNTAPFKKEIFDSLSPYWQNLIKTSDEFRANFPELANYGLPLPAPATTATPSQVYAALANAAVPPAPVKRNNVPF